MESLLDKSTVSPTPLPILQRIGGGDRLAVEECINLYGNLIWALAKKHTASIEEAETAALKIFQTIWQVAERFDVNVCDEKQFIGLIVRKILRMNDE